MNSQFSISKELIESFGYTLEDTSAAKSNSEMVDQLGKKEGIDWHAEIIPGVDYTALDLAMDLGFVAIAAVAGTALAVPTGGASEVAAMAAEATRLARIVKGIKWIWKNLTIDLRGDSAVQMIKKVAHYFKEGVKGTLLATYAIKAYQEIKGSEGSKDTASVAKSTSTTIPTTSSEKTTEIKPTAKIPEVSELQSKLKAAGIDIGKFGVDGKFGPDTVNAVQAYRTKLNLPTDVDAVAALLNIKPEDATLSETERMVRLRAKLSQIDEGAGEWLVNLFKGGAKGATDLELQQSAKDLLSMFSKEQIDQGISIGGKLWKPKPGNPAVWTDGTTEQPIKDIVSQAKQEKTGAVAAATKSTSAPKGTTFTDSEGQQWQKVSDDTSNGFGNWQAVTGTSKFPKASMLPKELKADMEKQWSEQSAKSVATPVAPGVTPTTKTSPVVGATKTTANIAGKTVGAVAKFMWNHKMLTTIAALAAWHYVFGTDGMLHKEDSTSGQGGDPTQSDVTQGDTTPDDDTHLMPGQMTDAQKAWWRKQIAPAPGY